MTTPARSAIGRADNTRSALQSGSSTVGGGTTFRALILIVRDRILETLSLVTPAPPLVAPQRTTGTTAYAYRLVALNAKGHSAASDEGTTAQGAPALGPSAFMRLTWTAVPRATGYELYRT